MQIKPRFAKFFARFRRDRRGTTAVELAALAPLLTGLIIPLIDLGMGTYQQMRIEDAAQAGARYAGLNGYAQSDIQNAASAATGLTGVNAVASEACHCIVSGAIGNAVGCGTACADGSTPGTFVTVTATKSYTLLLPYPLLPSALTLSGTANVRIQ